MATVVLPSGWPKFSASRICSRKGQTPQHPPFNHGKVENYFRSEESLAANSTSARMCSANGRGSGTSPSPVSSGSTGRRLSVMGRTAAGIGQVDQPRWNDDFTAKEGPCCCCYLLLNNSYNTWRRLKFIVTGRIVAGPHPFTGTARGTFDPDVLKILRWSFRRCRTTQTGFYATAIVMSVREKSPPLHSNGSRFALARA